ncbi:anti-sigma factor family protein [Streptomyces sp. NPDC059909]|uniref:anti-sigma factor family protein n=1 Tax=Streptomyces sp. NPDC059909 TaxID=3346998 RepID=UPI00365EA6E2
MTSTTGTTQHPDVSEISDLTEGLLSPSRQAAVREHLDGCALCADVRASLEEIRDLLGTLPGPPRMPADIAGRIDAALAAEALLSATAPDDEPVDVSRETSTTEPQTESPPADRPAGHPRAATGPGRSRPPRRRRRTAVLSAAFGVAAAGVSLLLAQSLAGTSGDKEASTKSGVSAADTASDFSENRLQARVHALLAPYSAAKDSTQGGTKPAPRSEAEPSAGIETDPQSPMRTSATAVPACIQKGTGRADPALAAEQGTYAGTEAYLVVLPHSSDSSQVQAYVVDAACVATAPSGKGELLLTHSYPRP